MTVEIESHPLHHHQNLLQPQRRPPSSTCDLHPGEAVTGFCASCLRERLAGLEPPAASSGRKSTSALRSVFQKVSAGAAPAAGPSFLRRSKSFSFARGGGGDGFSAQRPPAASFEPQRKSCDVRGRSTLWSLFHRDDHHHRVAESPCVPPSGAASTAVAVVVSNGALTTDVDCRNQGLLAPSVAPTLSEIRKEDGESDDEIKPVDPVDLVVGSSGEIDEEGNEMAEEKAELKPMKDHIDLDSQPPPQQQQTKKPSPKDLKEIASSFWLAASVFSKKLQKWRRRQKLKKQGGENAMPAEKPPKASRRFRDTQSEVAVDASGRRSCDTDPRFSLDAGRMSFDDPRFSWDEPRASWDGYLIGGRSVFPRLPPMLSVVEDPPAQTVQRSDYLIPVEEDTAVPGGSAQTRDYYLDSSSRRRRSLDRSNSIKEQPAEITEPKPVSNGKVSPTGGMDFFHFPNGTLLDRDVKDWSSNSLRDDYLGSFESAFRDPHRGAAAKKSRRWGKAWNIWGFIQKRNSSRGETNIVERSLSESWPELRSSSFNNRILRSNSSVSSRNSFSGNAGFGGMRKASMKSSGHKKRKDDFVLERNKSARYSPNHVDNGMLRFYLTPMRNSRRNGVSASGRQIPSHYFTRSMLGLH
ncbi:UPF0503 protein, chloroplastic [Canna indica]|uniref:UPF0503 protein, chloroplastic n=1 Tax=Canna indica TaxID=4628 RepID=A0AAQ3K540_9LILI|nr:UPF0503 protein, chloroplastic [Canna indica]